MQTQPVVFVSHTRAHEHKTKSAANQGNGPMCYHLAPPQGSGAAVVLAIDTGACLLKFLHNLCQTGAFLLGDSHGRFLIKKRAVSLR